MRIGKRQEGQNAIIVENLARHAAMRLFGADCGNQCVMTVIPEGQRNIRFVTQPELAPSAPTTSRAVSMSPLSRVINASFSPHATC